MTAEDLGAAGAMTVLLKDAIKPNLIQTLEGQPCLMHAGPFANIAHGNSSLIADLLGLKLGEYVITESGFGSDMGMEKFIDIVCRAGGHRPERGRRSSPRCGRSSTTAASTTTRRRARRSGSRRSSPGSRTCVRHLGIVREFGAPGGGRGQPPPRGHRRGGRARARGSRPRPARSPPPSATGSPRAARASPTWPRPSSRPASEPNEFRFLYEDGDSIKEKIETIAERVYGAAEVVYYLEAEQRSSSSPTQGLPSSRSAWRRRRSRSPPIPSCSARPTGFQLPVRDVRAYTGAGWLVPLCGDDPADARARQDRRRLRRRHRRRGPNRRAVLSACGRPCRPTDRLRRARRPRSREAAAGAGVALGARLRDGGRAGGADRQTLPPTGSRRRAAGGRARAAGARHTRRRASRSAARRAADDDAARLRARSRRRGRRPSARRRSGARERSAAGDRRGGRRGRLRRRRRSRRPADWPFTPDAVVAAELAAAAARGAAGLVAANLSRVERPARRARPGRRRRAAVARDRAAPGG